MPGELVVRGPGDASCRQCGGGFVALASAFGALRTAGVDQEKLQDLLVKQAKKVRVCATCAQMFTSIPVDGEAVHLCMSCGGAWIDRGALERLSGASREPPPPPLRAPPKPLLAPPLPRTVTPPTAKLQTPTAAERERMARAAPMPSPSGLLPPRGADEPPRPRPERERPRTQPPALLPAPLPPKPRMRAAAAAPAAPANPNRPLQAAIGFALVGVVILLAWWLNRPTDVPAVRDIGGATVIFIASGDSPVLQEGKAFPLSGPGMQMRASAASTSSFEATSLLDVNDGVTAAQILGELYGNALAPAGEAAHVRGLSVLRAEGVIDGRRARARVYTDGKKAWVLAVIGDDAYADVGETFLGSLSET